MGSETARVHYTFWKRGSVASDDFAVRCETVGDGRIPMVHGTGEVLVKDERHAARFAEATISEANAVGLDELRRPGAISL